LQDVKGMVESEQSIRIRQFMPNDMEAIEEIEKTSIRYITPLSFLVTYYEVNPAFFLVAEVHRKVVGYAIANLRKTDDGKEEGHLLGIVVDPAYRRRRVGFNLIRHLINLLKDQNIERLSMEVKVNNFGGRKFYSLLGFKESCILKRYYRMRGYSEDAVLMTRELNQVEERCP